MAGGMSRNAVWRCIKVLEDQVVITGRVALVNSKNWALVCCLYSNQDRAARGRLDPQTCADRGGLTSGYRVVPNVG